MARKNDFPRLKGDLSKIEGLFKRLPDITGRMYINFILDNFKEESWEGKPWPKRRSKERGRALLVNTGRLKRSFRFFTRKLGGKTMLTVFTDVPYAEVHNEGANTTISTKVRAHTRRTNTRKTSVKAHTRQQKIKIPKRQFIGPSESFNKELVAFIENAIRKL